MGAAIQAANADGGKGFADQVAELRPRLCLYARRLTGDHALIDDLVQEAIARAIAHQSAYQPGRNLAVWLCVILKHAYIDHVRRRRDGSSVDPESLPIPADQFWRAFGADISRAVNTLKPRDRAALVMFHHEGRSQADICATLGITSMTLRMLLHHARLKLQKLLSDEPHTEGASA